MDSSPKSPKKDVSGKMPPVASLDMDSSPKIPKKDVDGKMPPIASCLTSIIDIFICLFSLALTFHVATQSNVPEFEIPDVPDVRIAIVIGISAGAFSFVVSALALLFTWKTWKKIQTSAYNKCCSYV